MRRYGVLETSAGSDVAVEPCGLAEMEDDVVTGEICVALIAAPPSSSGSGAIDHELATVRGLAAVEEEIAGVGGGP